MERRKHPRVKSRHRISVVRLPEEREETISASADWYYTFDISKGGIRFVSDEAIPAMTRLRIDLIRLSPRDRIILSGVVRWSAKHDNKGKYHVGVELLSSDPRCGESWSRYVQSKMQHSS